MGKRQFVLIPGAVLALLFSVGCMPKSNIKHLNKGEVSKQEAAADQARQEFFGGRYDEAVTLLEPMCQERTTSQPLYLSEIGTVYLARNDKANAKRYLLETYTCLDEFLDPSSEKKAMSLWGAEAEKVYKGEPYEQATLSLFVGLLLLEEGDVDNALSCFKTGQLCDSDVENEQYKSDYGLLQLLEAKCYQLRGEQTSSDQFVRKALGSFANTHPLLQTSEIETADAKRRLIRQYDSYYGPLVQPYNTLLLIWTDRSPEMRRVGAYGEQRVLAKNSLTETHCEISVDGSSRHEAIRGFADITFQATTRGGREMDNVLAGQAEFKAASHQMGNALIDMADDISHPYMAIGLLAAGLVSHGIGAATNVEADIRCWKTLPDEIRVVPLQLAPGTHRIHVDYYDQNLMLTQRLDYDINTEDRPFQFFNIVLSSANSN